MAKTPKKDDAYWMGLALGEAVKARGRTSPNPMVGAVLVKDGKLLAKGYHRRAGLPHAEIEAMRRVKNLKGATLYVTLEPCCHEGKRTPPCTGAILGSGIRKVVIGTLDPNPKVSGKGAKMLRRAGIKVEVGVLEEDCRQINVFYNHWIRGGTPWVLLKVASSLDGRIALANGKSRWITGEHARHWVHRLRNEVDAVLVGIGTAQADDPALTVRHKSAACQPIRIVLDPKFQISPRAKVFDPGIGAPAWLLVEPKFQNSRKRSILEKRGHEVIAAPLKKNGRVDLKKLLALLGKKGVLSLLVEGGPGVWTEFLQQNAFQELWAFVAPKLLGAEARPMFLKLGLKRLDEQSALKLSDVEVLGDDVLLVYRSSLVS